jgi:hypothetical protein
MHFSSWVSMLGLCLDNHDTWQILLFSETVNMLQIVAVVFMARTHLVTPLCCIICASKKYFGCVNKFEKKKFLNYLTFYTTYSPHIYSKILNLQVSVQ